MAVGATLVNLFYQALHSYISLAGLVGLVEVISSLQKQQISQMKTKSLLMYQLHLG